MSASITIPRRLPLLLVADNVLLPGSSMRIPVRSIKNMNMVKSRLLGRNTLSSTVIGVIPKQHKSEDEDEDITGLHPIGTAAVVVQITGTNWPRPAYTLLVTGLCRFKVNKLLQESPYPVATVTQLDKLAAEDKSYESSDEDLTSLAEHFRDQAAKLVEMLDISIPVVAKLKRMLESLPSQHLPDVCAAIVKASYSEKLQVLDAVDLTDRFNKALPLLVRQIEGLKLLQKARKDGKVEIITRRENNRPINMRQLFRKLNTPNLQEEDGDENEDLDESEDMEQKIKECKMPDVAHKAAIKELKRLKKMPQHMPEHAMIRNYLELMTELPWSKATKDALDIVQARIALGGVADQSDIRGHRRTYIGSMPGRIIQGLKTVNVNNPVFLFDEIDKLSRGPHGDPAAALLEVLDPEQNHGFVDHYLNVPFDLSQVLFIATANNMATIPPALLDRMEVIQIPGYTEEEKIHIAIRHLIPKQLTEHGLTEDKLQIPDDTVKIIVSSYTREAGVRKLERRLAAICRAVAVRVAEGMSKTKHETDSLDSERKEMLNNNSFSEVDSTTASTLAHPPEMPIVIDEAALEDILGPPVYETETKDRLQQPGVAIGLAWTAMGGEIMFVEASRVENTEREGKLTLTGQLGDVMKESANLALNWVRANSKKLNLKIDGDIFNCTDVHIHFPAGAVGKDGPSAGVTIVTVLVSLFSGKCVRADTAMTGEITLRGLVLPVGGIKEKVLAAHRAGIDKIILPKRNEKDLHEIPDNIRKDISFIFASQLADVLNAAFEDGFPALAVSVMPDSKL